MLGVKTYSDPSYIFSGGQDPHTHNLRPWSRLAWVRHCVFARLYLRRTRAMAVRMCLCNAAATKPSVSFWQGCHIAVGRATHRTTRSTLRRHRRGVPISCVLRIQPTLRCVFLQGVLTAVVQRRHYGAPCWHAWTAGRITARARHQLKVYTSWTTTSLVFPFYVATFFASFSVECAVK